MVQAGDQCFWPEEGYARIFRRGEVVSLAEDGEHARVLPSDGGGELRLQTSRLQLANPANADEADDLGDLSVLNDGAMLHAISRRFLAHSPHEQIYTRAGGLLVAVNPFRVIEPLYNRRTMEKYAVATRDLVPGDASGLHPHLYEVAGTAFSSLRRYGTPNAIVVSGESGAGKTESVKKILQFLTTAADMHIAQPVGSQGTEVSSGAELCEQLVESGPLLEAFGNCKTRRNDNSSRFGKLMELHFSPGGRVMGGALSHYLLEQARVVEHAQGERSFHFFYQLCARAEAVAGIAAADRTADDEMVAALDLRAASSFAFLATGAQLGAISGADGAPIDDLEESGHTLERLAHLVPSRSQRTALLHVIAAVLWLGELDFCEGPGDGCAVVDEEDEGAMRRVAALLRVGEKDLARALTERTITAGGEVCHVPKSVSEAFDSRDALAKALYCRLFDLVVRMLNQALGAGLTRAKGDGEEPSLICLLRQYLSQP